MTSTLDPYPLSECDDPAAVLAAARDARRVENDAARTVLKAAVRFAALHSRDSLVGPADGWHESGLPLGGEGCPEVAEFAVVELAAALGRSTESGRRYLTRGIEGCYRLPACWPGSRPATWRRGGSGSSPTAPCVSHPPPGSWTATSRRWRPGSAPPSSTG
jgi:hypothetical protein